MRYWTGAALVLFVALFQAASVDQFRILGVAPNVVLVMLVAWTVVRGLDDVLPMIAIAGIALGFVGVQTPGVVLLALLPLAGLGLLREMHIVHSDLLLVLLLVLATSLMYESIMLLSVAATGGTSDLLLGVRHAVIPAAIVNLAITPPVYFVMRFAKPAATRRRLVY
jgi:cell shape-determining protein MreD